MFRRSILLLVVLGVAACTGGAEETTTTSLLPPVSSTSTTEPPPSSTSSSVTTTTTTRTMLPQGIESLSPEMQQEIIDLVAITEEIRGLAFLQPPTIVVVTPEELAIRVQDGIQEDIENVPADEALYDLMGLIDPEVDLLQLYLDLYGEQVGGYYDLETGELVVPSGDEFTEFQKATLVHELVHAVTDQRFGSGDAYRDLVDNQRFDQAVAFLAVTEGDATLTQVLYIQQLELEAQQALLTELFGSESPVFDSVPQFIQESLTFPYEEGLAFVQRAFEIGGFDEVNRLYVEPPVSSEQIIEPRDYQRDMPTQVTLNPPDLNGYEVVYESVWGQLGFELIFDQILGGAEDAVEGWGGDSYIQWFDGTEAALLIEFQGDERADAEEMFEAFVAYATTMAVEDSVESAGEVVFEGEDFAFVRLAGDSVVFVAAGDLAIGRQLVSSLP